MIKLRFPLKDLTFLKTGGVCDILFEPESLQDLQNFVISNNDKHIVILGAMSNVIIPDDGIRGAVIRLSNSAFQKIDFLYNNKVYVDSGVSVNSFIKICAKNNISCIEEMYAIPGTIGGAISMNAGTPIFEISEAILKIECISKKTGKIIVLPRDNIKFEYRKSNLPDDLIITSCILKTKNLNRDVILKRTKEIFEKRKMSQPITSATCGSTFKNPDGSTYKAWELIKTAGCSGMCVGEAVLSDMHCNFIINKGGATSTDILKLISLIKESVYKKHGIILEEEVRLIANYLL
ncbi:MAG: UDP-N-acetylmuramate dehydrogenase [Holosporales bacterium]|nr:UDP-N-acetylmuramate dehydrogenase [Holosporales bacterium]